MTSSTLTWAHNGVTHTAFWHSERGQSVPSRIELADDRISADAAYRLASQGVGLLWQGDFQNARHLLQALDRRINQRARVAVRRKGTDNRGLQKPQAALTQAFWAQRQAQAHRAQILGCVLVPLQADYSIALRRAPDVRLACTEAWGDGATFMQRPDVHHEPTHVCRLRELLGVIGAHEWRKKGVEIPALGLDRHGRVQRIHAHHGVFSPVRGEYVELVAQAPLPTGAADGAPDAQGDPSQLIAWDIGTGTGVLAAVLAQRGLGRVIATDASPKAVICAKDNLQRLRDAARQTMCEPEVILADLFPPQGLCDKADLVVCNPPWLPSPAGSALDAAVYDEDGRMLHGFLAGVAKRLAAGGQVWLILSDLAERLGLRTTSEVGDAVQTAGLRVIAKHHAKPLHSRSRDTGDALFAARSQEVTSLWCLSHAHGHAAQ